MTPELRIHRRGRVAQSKLNRTGRQRKAQLHNDSGEGRLARHISDVLETVRSKQRLDI